MDIAANWGTRGVRASSDQGELFLRRERFDIPGAAYLREFVSDGEERELIREIERGTWTHEFARRRQHYGIGYEKPDWTKPAPLPPWIERMARRIVDTGFRSREGPGPMSLPGADSITELVMKSRTGQSRLRCRHGLKGWRAESSIQDLDRERDLDP